MKQWLRNNWFLLGLAGVVILAWIFPEPGAREGFFRSEITSQLGIMLIFFFQGLTLSTAVLKSGLMQWRLHLFIQGFVFVVIPLATMLLLLAGGDFLPEGLRTGFLFLAVLPTTIATSVAYTAMTQGNVAGAVFNSSLANLAGIFITPLWISLWLQVEGMALPLGQLFLDISLILLAPLLAGQLARFAVGSGMDKYKKILSSVSSGIILFIVYTVFCNSWQEGIWYQGGSQAALGAALGAGLLFVCVLGLVALGVSALKFEYGNAMAALFCCPQKTMAAGVPMASLIFETHRELSLILLPLMFYHPLQLLVGGLLAGRIKAKNA